MSEYFDIIPNYLDEKNYFLIKNNFEEILDEYSDNFKINLYYLDEFLCKIIVRRIDKNEGWAKNLRILLNGLDKKSSEIISIGSSDYQSKIMEVYTKIKIEKLEKIEIIEKIEIVEKIETVKKIETIKKGEKGEIGEKDEKIDIDYKNIIQCGKDNFFENNIKFLNFTNIIDNNIHFKYLYFNIYEQRKFIKQNFSKYLDLYDSIKDIEIKNMLFICNYLYLNGGCYISLNIDFNKQIADYSKNINYYSVDKNNILDIYFTSKENTDILDYLNLILIKIGYLESNEIKLDKKETTVLFKNSKKILDKEFIKNIDNYVYSIDKVFYKNIFKINNYIFIINSENTNYIIEYLNLDYLLIKTIDINGIIENNLELLCIDNETSIYNNITFNENININIVIFNVNGDKFIKKI